VVLADAFEDKPKALAERMENTTATQVYGWDAYQKAVDSDAEFVILTSPPNFRPVHFAAAVEEGKHVMTEKPIAVDAPGCRQFVKIGQAATNKGLTVVAGTQRRHELKYLRNAAKIQNGAIGEILGGTVSWNGTVPWIYGREPAWSDAEYLGRNWLNFTELSGDHIVEQHVHNLDVANWFLGRTPVTAVGFGGRHRRQSGNQYDFFSVDLDYGDGVHIHSQCRQISGCYNRVGEFFRGTHGECFGGGKMSGKDVSIPEIKFDAEQGVIQEMVNLMKSAWNMGPYFNEAKQVSQSTATAIMGRLAAYSGKMVRWTDLWQNDKSEFYALKLGPTAKQFEEGNVIAPLEDVVRPGDGVAIRRRA
jgi:predicted dehydrogenase